MIYLIGVLTIVSILWSIFSKTKISLYLNVALMLSVSTILFLKNNLSLSILLALMCVYSCMIYDPKQIGKEKTLINIAKYLPIVVATAFCLFFFNDNKLSDNISIEATVLASITTMFSILFWMSAIKTSKAKTKGDRSYE